MKNIIIIFIASVLLCGCGIVGTKYARLRYYIKPSTDPALIAESIENIILNNNYYKQSQSNDIPVVFAHKEHDRQKIYVKTVSNTLLVDFIFYNQKSSDDPDKVIAEIYKYSQENDFEFTTNLK